MLLTLPLSFVELALARKRMYFIPYSSHCSYQELRYFVSRPHMIQGIVKSGLAGNFAQTQLSTLHHFYVLASLCCLLEHLFKWLSLKDGVPSAPGGCVPADTWLRV